MFVNEKQDTITVKRLSFGQTKKGATFTALMDEKGRWWNIWGEMRDDIKLGSRYGIFYSGRNVVTKIFLMKGQNA